MIVTIKIISPIANILNVIFRSGVSILLTLTHDQIAIAKFLVYRASDYKNLIICVTRKHQLARKIIIRATLASAGISCGYVSVCPSVCSSATSRCSTEAAKRSITQTTPHNSPGTLVFWCRKSR